MEKDEKRINGTNSFLKPDMEEEGLDAAVMTPMGRKRISIDRSTAMRDGFLFNFKKFYER